MFAQLTVLEIKNSSKADNARKNTAFPPVCKKCAKVCRAPEKGKSNEESYDSSFDFGALEGTRIPGPLIKRAHRASYSDFEAFEFTSFCANHRDFLPGSFCTLCRILQVRVPIASLETVHLLWDK